MCSTDLLAALLAAAAAGTAPPGAYVSEEQQLVRLTEVAPPGSTSAAAEKEANLEATGPVVLDFERVSETPVGVTFGGWQVQGKRHARASMQPAVYAPVAAPLPRLLFCLLACGINPGLVASKVQPFLLAAVDPGLTSTAAASAAAPLALMLLAHL